MPTTHARIAMDSIAKTSLLTAAMRAIESGRTDAEGRLFSDPFADALAGGEGHELLSRAIAAAGEQPAIAIRTAFFDDKIAAASKRGIKQVVALAAGMDTRCYRLAWPAGTRVFELDRAEVFAYKNAVLHRHAPRCERHCIPVDLRLDWQRPLLEAGFQASAQTIWIVEGLLMYLDEGQVHSLFQRVNLLAQPGDVLLADILSKTLLEVPHMQGQLRFLASIGAPWRFGTDDPVSFLGELGWRAQLSQPGDFAPTRWPFPSVPLSVPNVPRGYYATAERS